MLNQSKRIFISGIKGVAMANLALILSKMGKEIIGWDVKEEFITKPIIDKLKQKQLILIEGSKKINYLINLLKNIDLYVYSAAHQPINNLLFKKISSVIPRFHQAQIIGEIMKQFQIPIAVAGSHGKTTISSLLSYSLIQLNQKPSYLVGTSSFNNYFGGDYHQPSKTKFFIAEADEYGLNPPIDKTPKFFFLSPKYIIANNIDYDHPDVYQNLEEVKIVFNKFFKDRKIIANGDNQSLLSTLKKINRKQYLLYGFHNKNDYQIKNYSINEDISSFNLYFYDKKIESFKIKIFGLMNILNSAAVITLLLHLGFSAKEIKKAIKDFTGAKRRFEIVYQKNDIKIFDDYAHHPTEIEKTIEAAKLRFPKRRIIVIFQPHTFSRTKKLLKEFNHSLSKADLAFILPIFPSARENPTYFNVSSQSIITINNKNNLIFVEDKKDLFNRLTKTLTKSDIIFTMGAGDVYKLKDDLIFLVNRYASN